MKVAVFFALVAVVAARPMNDCATCKQVVVAIDSQLKSNATVTEIENTIFKICDAIPGAADECKQYVKQYVPEIVDMIAASITPDKICDELHLCNSSFIGKLMGAGLDLPMGPGPVILSPQEDVPLFQENVKKPEAGELCTICEFAIKEIETELSNNATEAEIIALVEKVCDILPSSVKTQCQTLIEQEGAQIINLLINKADPKVVCTALGLCTNASQALAARKEIAAVHKPAAGTFCTICEFALKEIESELSDNATEAEVLALVEKVCDILPSTVKSECQSLIEQEGPQIIQLLINKGDPAKVCTMLGLCSNSTLQLEAVAVVEQPESGPLCTICEFAIRTLESKLVTNSSEQDIIDAVEKVCDILPSTVKSECQQLIEQHGTEIINLLLQKASAAEICGILGICTAAGRPMAARANDHPYCQICEQVMTYVQSFLKQNSTTEEIEDVLDKVCQYLPGSLQDQCKELVDSYTPQIVAELAKATKPDQVCAEIQLCAAAAERVMPLISVV